MKTEAVIVLDGHDGSGKTTLAERLAATLGGEHIRPFSGERGRLFIAAAEAGNSSLAVRMAFEAVEDARAGAVAPILIFDRHWMTVFSVVPQNYLSDWKPLPPTTLCWVDLETTRMRLAQRGEIAPDGYHLRYLSIYRKLAQRYGCPILRTDLLSPDECLDRLVSWAKGLMQREY